MEDITKRKQVLKWINPMNEGRDLLVHLRPLFRKKPLHINAWLGKWKSNTLPSKKP
jgi:hypothetical protein